jgi:hypothetical protein
MKALSSRNPVVAALTLLLAVGGHSSVIAEQTPTVAMFRGGSDYPFYTANGCSAGKYTVIPNYVTQKATIDSELKEMYASGQRSIGLTMWYMHGAHGAVTNSIGGNLDPATRAGLQSLLATLKTIGFENLKFNLAPVGESYPWQRGVEWPEWREDIYQEDLSFIKNVRAVVAASDLRYVIQLGGFPPPQGPLSVRFSQRLWRDYVGAFGVSDTVGFGIPTHGQSSGSWAIMPALYGGTPPGIIGLSVVENAPAKMDALYQWLQSIGFANRPWSRARPCGDVDVPYPSQFDAYLQQGF